MHVRTVANGPPVVPVRMQPCCGLNEEALAWDWQDPTNYQTRMLAEPGVEFAEVVGALRFRRGDVYFAISIGVYDETEYPESPTPGEKVSPTRRWGTPHPNLQLVWLLGLKRFALIASPHEVGEGDNSRVDSLPWDEDGPEGSQRLCLFSVALIKGNPFASSPTEPLELDVVDREGVVQEWAGWHPARGWVHAEKADCLVFDEDYKYFCSDDDDRIYGWRAGNTPQLYFAAVLGGPGFPPPRDPWE